MGVREGGCGGLLQQRHAQLAELLDAAARCDEAREVGHAPDGHPADGDARALLLPLWLLPLLWLLLWLLVLLLLLLLLHLWLPL